MNLEISCPSCKSLNIRRKYHKPISKYGYLPKPPVDYCDECGFSSEESFYNINIKLNRDYKLQEIFNEFQ